MSSSSFLVIIEFRQINASVRRPSSFRAQKVHAKNYKWIKKKKLLPTNHSEPILTRRKRSRWIKSQHPLTARVITLKQNILRSTPAPVESQVWLQQLQPVFSFVILLASFRRTAAWIIRNRLNICSLCTLDNCLYNATALRVSVRIR